jgi:hypothetical protein
LKNNNLLPPRTLSNCQKASWLKAFVGVLDRSTK